MIELAFALAAVFVAPSDAPPPPLPAVAEISRDQENEPNVSAEGGEKEQHAAEPAPRPYRGVVLKPIEAVVKAADAAPEGVFAAFEMNVAAIGTQDGLVYLNSEKDYRDQRCLTIAILPEAQKALNEQFGGDLRQALLGKTIRVLGVARRVQVDFYSDGERTDKYYYQTHVGLVKAEQLISVNEPD
ncbi:hypothetical protein [Croceicoccus bisphenolivorans]|uniref:hypothetical protein n=1 Tax=Croceicoccus bisphenolivorans TaxID=1783232 RepID=UPI00082A8D8D|nr:hypothetical protein [Croceicoccus bisphenolivorans]